MADDRVYDLTASGAPHFASVAALLRASTKTPVPALVEALTLCDLPAYAFTQLNREPDVEVAHLLAPVDEQEVWGAGVTYAWSREARVREAKSKDIYVRVYEAERPELFFKAPGEKVVGPNDWIGLRGDSHWNVPEPELTLVINPAMQVVGYTIGNDVCSRDIEGENPLYLPQAKIYRHSCAVGPLVTLTCPKESDDLAIRLTISRDGSLAFHGQTTTAAMNRRLTELVGYLGRYNDFRSGVLLLTGTGIVPGDEFTLQDGDEVTIEIGGIGVLHNTVRRMD